MRILFAVVALALLQGCAGSPTDIFAGPDEALQNVFIKGQPQKFTAEELTAMCLRVKAAREPSLDCTGKGAHAEVTVVPVDPRRPMVVFCDRACIDMKTSTVYIRQSDVRDMARIFWTDEYQHYLGGMSSRRHKGDTWVDFDFKAAERTAKFERERAEGCARAGMACY